MKKPRFSFKKHNNQDQFLQKSYRNFDFNILSIFENNLIFTILSQKLIGEFD